MPDEVPTSQVYTHLTCGRDTTILKEPFAELCNPLSLVTRTSCSRCGKKVGLANFEWSDTGERLDAYRRRLRASAPLRLKLYAWLIGPLAFGLAGYGVGSSVGGVGWKAPVLGVIGGVILHNVVLLTLILRTFARIDYRAEK